jgi:hypothetical protein
MTESGFEARLETFTKPHQLDRRPGALMREFREFSELWRWYGKNQEGLNSVRAVGSHLGREINWGTNGWHYHHHRLRYDALGTFSADTARAGWLATLESKGLRTEGTEAHAYRVDAVGSEAGARYVAKLAKCVEAEARAVGREVSSSATKGRNINTLLRHFVGGDEDAGNQWVNGVACVTATKVSSVRWSRGLRYRVGMDEERPDEAIAAEEITAGDVCLGFLRPWQWRVIIELNCELALLVHANGGRAKCDEFLAGIGAGQLLEDEPEVSHARF